MAELLRVVRCALATAIDSYIFIWKFNICHFSRSIEFPMKWFAMSTMAHSIYAHDRSQIANELENKDRIFVTLPKKIINIIFDL